MVSRQGDEKMKDKAYKARPHEWRIVTCLDCKEGMWEFYLEVEYAGPKSTYLPKGICPLCKGHNIEAFSGYIIEAPETLGKHSGPHSITTKLSELGVEPLSDKDVDEILAAIRELAVEGRMFTDMEFLTIVINFLKNKLDRTVKK